MALTFLSDVVYFWKVAENSAISQALTLHGTGLRPIKIVYTTIYNRGSIPFDIHAALWATIYILDAQILRSPSVDRWTFPSRYWVRRKAVSFGKIDLSLYFEGPQANETYDQPISKRRTPVANESELDTSSANVSDIAINDRPSFRVQRVITDTEKLSRVAVVEHIELNALAFMAFQYQEAVANHFHFNTGYIRTIQYPQISSSIIVLYPTYPGSPITTLQDVVNCLLEALEGIVVAETIFGFRVSCFWPQDKEFARFQVTAKKNFGDIPVGTS